MQTIIYAMDAPKVRGATLAATIGGMFAAGSIVLIFSLAHTAQPEAAQWFWLYVVLGWSLFVLLAELFVYLLSLRVPFFRHLANVLIMTTVAFGFLGQAVHSMTALLRTEGVEPMVDVESQAWFSGSGLFALLIAILWILVAVRGSKGGTLTLGDDGLTCAVQDKRWRWAWHELPAFELSERGGLVGRLLGRHVAVERGHKALITDVWNRPLDEVLAGLNERRQRALAARRDSGLEDRMGEAWAGADLAEVCYRQSRKSRVRRGAILGVLVLLLLSAVGWRYLVTYDSFGAYWAAETGIIVVAGGLILLLLEAIAVTSHPRVAARVFLRLDGKGLTLGGLFRRRRWFWYDLSAFELDKRRLSGPAVYFFFRGPGPHAAVASGQISDSYDRPLAEIAAKLNDYREQALANAPHA